MNKTKSPKKQHNVSKVIKLSIRSTKEVLRDFAEALGKTRKGQKIEPNIGVSFESIDGLRNVLTTRRLELLSTVRHKKPQSVYELSKLLKRDLKSVNTDLKVLKDNDFIELQKIDEGRHRLIPRVNFENIKITVDV